MRRFAGARPEDVQIKDVSCLGRCDQAPAVAINDQIFASITPDRAEDLVRRAIREDELRADHLQEGRVACASDPYGEGEKYGVVRRLIATKDWDGVLATLKEAELRGIGRRRIPHFDEVGSGAQASRSGEIHRVQRR